MSIIEMVSDVKNTFLSRRELVCNFAGLGGKLKKLEAIDMITKEFKLDGKVVIPIKLQNHIGKPLVTGTFYVYDDEKLAKDHVNPTILSRLEKAKKPADESKQEKPVTEKTEEIKTKEAGKEKKDEKPAKEAKVEEKTDMPKAKTKTEEKSDKEKSE